jgi:PBP1b-binding outer membrane lipoprotein LpoB
MKIIHRNLRAVVLTVMAVTSVFASGCASSFKAQRVNAQEADDRAMAITDKWVIGDTNLVIDGTMKKIYEHIRFQKFMNGRGGKEAKLFVGEIQNNTSEAYFPVKDLEDAFLEKLSNSNEFVLIDAAQREAILKEITYQNDGMVDPAQAKQIGKQSGADLMIFGSVNMKPEVRDGKTIKSYTVNLRLTNVETAEEVCRTREVVNKYSEQSGKGW